MILIGQYDSPFVRRVGIALELYGLAFEHQPWSAFGDAGRLRALNPLTRVPTLVLPDGDVLVESCAMLDYLDGLVPEERRLFPVHEPMRRRALKVAALATGIADKGVSLFYEQRLHEEASEIWVARCRAQIGAALAALEADRAWRPDDYWFGARIGHADIAVAATLRFLSEAHSGAFPLTSCPALAAHAARCEALPVFAKISQAFIAPT